MGQSLLTTPSTTTPPRPILQSIPRSAMPPVTRSNSVVHRTKSRKKNWKKATGASLRVEGASPIRRLSRAITGQRKDRVEPGISRSRRTAQAGPLLVSDSHGSLDKSHETYKLAASRPPPSRSTSTASYAQYPEADADDSIHHFVQNIPPTQRPGGPKDPGSRQPVSSSRDGLQRRPSRSRSVKKVNRTRTKSRASRRKVDIQTIEPLRIDKSSRGDHLIPLDLPIQSPRLRSPSNDHYELPYAAPLPSSDRQKSTYLISDANPGREASVASWTTTNTTRSSIDASDRVPLCLTPGAGKPSTFPSSITFVHSLLMHPLPLRIDAVPCPTGRRASTPRPVEYDPDYLDRCPFPQRINWLEHLQDPARSSSSPEEYVDRKSTLPCDSSIGSSLGSTDSQECLSNNSRTTVSSGGPVDVKDHTSPPPSTTAVLPLSYLLPLQHCTPKISPAHFIPRDLILCHHGPSSTLDIHFPEFDLDSSLPRPTSPLPLPFPSPLFPSSPSTLIHSPGMVETARKMDFSTGSPSSLHALTLPLFDFDPASSKVGRDAVSRPGDTRRRGQAVGVRRSSGKEQVEMLPMPGRCDVMHDCREYKRVRSRQRTGGRGEKGEEVKRGLDRAEVSSWLRGVWRLRDG